MNIECLLNLFNEFIDQLLNLNFHLEKKILPYKIQEPFKKLNL